MVELSQWHRDLADLKVDILAARCDSIHLSSSLIDMLAGHWNAKNLPTFGMSRREDLTLQIFHPQSFSHEELACDVFCFK